MVSQSLGLLDYSAIFSCYPFKRFRPLVNCDVLSNEFSSFSSFLVDSGTTWTQELVWLIANDCDFEGAKKKLNDRSPFIEYDVLFTRTSEIAVYYYI